MNEIQTNRAKREIVFVNFTGKRKIKEMIMKEKKKEAQTSAKLESKFHRKRLANNKQSGHSQRDGRVA